MLIYDLLLVADVFLLGAVAFLYSRSPAASIFHPATFYLLFHGFVFTLRPIIARIYDFQYLYYRAEFHPTLGEKVTALLVADLAMCVFVAVSVKFASAPPPFSGNWRADAVRRQVRGPFLGVFAVLAPVALYSLLDYWIVSASASSTMLLDVATGVQINTDRNGWFTLAQLMLVPLTAIFAWLYRFRWWALLPFVAFFFLKAGTGGRGPFVVAAILLILLFLLEKRRRWPEWRSVLLLVVAAVAFNTVVVDRGKAIRSLFVEDYSRPGEIKSDEHPLDHPDFGNLEFLEYAVHVVPDRTGTYDYFLNNLQIFTEPVPRVWWPGKPIGPPIRLFNLMDYGRPLGWTWAVPGVGWMSLGWPGVAIQAMIFALLYGWLYRRFAAKNASVFMVLFYLVMVSATVVTFRDGGLLTILRQLPYYGGPIALTWMLCRLFGGERSSRGLPSRAWSVSPADRRRALAAEYQRDRERAVS